MPLEISDWAMNELAEFFLEEYHKKNEPAVESET